MKSSHQPGKRGAGGRRAVEDGEVGTFSDLLSCLANAIGRLYRTSGIVGRVSRFT